MFRTEIHQAVFLTALAWRDQRKRQCSKMTAAAKPAACGDENLAAY